MDKGLEKNITIADVAEALGVSKTTVSRAISGKGRIGRETRERVLAYIEEHDYKPNVIAKGLAQSKTYNICVVMPGEYDVVDLTFFQECLFGIQEIAGSMEYDILLSICRKNDISSLERITANPHRLPWKLSLQLPEAVIRFSLLSCNFPPCFCVILIPRLAVNTSLTFYGT